VDEARAMAEAAGEVLLATDVGGTFTDILAFDPRAGTIVAAFKLPSTPADPALAAITGLDRCLAREGRRPRAVFHATTVGTNALIEKRAGPIALVTTRGFRDVLALRRHARPRLYDLFARVSRPLVPRTLRLEVEERMDADGTVTTALAEGEVARVVALLRARGPRAVAVSLLHSYANDVHEQRLGEAIRSALPGVFVTLSSEVCREFREFERTSTTVVNAYIGPRVRGYVDALCADLDARGVGSLLIVKSNGGLTSGTNACRFPVHLIESGPAAGVVATAALGRAEGRSDLIAFDMGGTTAKVGVVRDGEPRLTTEFYADRFVDGVDLGGYPIQSPVIDVIEIGAGGGSIARIDVAGVVKVGPESAGAEPGPAAYGRGGDRPTVTDAHVAVGHIAADAFAGEDLELRAQLASDVIARELAAPLGWTVPQAAWGILRLATANMAEMVRLATLRRGLDPRDFALVAFGGAGPLHAAEIAREVGVPRVLVPQYPGLFSAIGAMLCDIRHDVVQTLVRRTRAVDAAEIEAAYRGLAQRAEALRRAEGAVGRTTDWTFERYADARFEGQLFALALPLAGGAAPSGPTIETAFRDAHVKSYGYDLPGHGVELVNVRLVARAAMWTRGWPVAATPDSRAAAGERRRTVFQADGTTREMRVLRREALAPGAACDGPLIIEDVGATVRVLEGQRVVSRASGVLEITG
jgi:N-methylhydantoinase A